MDRDHSRIITEEEFIAVLLERRGQGHDRRCGQVGHFVYREVGYIEAALQSVLRESAIMITFAAEIVLR